MPKMLIVASKNPVKLEATQQGFQQTFPQESFQLIGVSVESGVPDQPLSSAETLQGATNRCHNAKSYQPNADYWIGIEGGVEMIEGGLQCFAWVVVQNQAGQMGRGKTGVFYLPDEVARLVQQGMELGHADDAVFGRENSKQQNGAIGLLTNDLIDRTSYYVHAVIMALIPFTNPDLHWTTH